MTQKILPVNNQNITSARRMLEGVDRISFISLTEKDVIRSAIVQKSIRVYDKANLREREQTL